MVVFDEVPVAACDTLKALKDRMRIVEHRLIVDGVRAVLSDVSS